MNLRLAARLARRDVRRRPGRTTLVALLVAIPALGMTAGDVIVRTAHESDAEKFERDARDAELVVFNGAGGDVQRRPVDPAVLPEGSTILEVQSAGVSVQPEGEAYRHVELTDLSVRRAPLADRIEVRQGRGPSAEDEILLAPELARAWHVGVGDRLKFSLPDLDVRVTGIGYDRADHRSDLVVAHRSVLRMVNADYLFTRTYIDLPGRYSDTELADAQSAVAAATGLEMQSQLSNEQGALRGRELAWGWVAGTLALAVTGIIAAAAFATSARRQLVTLGQLAANGADLRLLRLNLSLQGAWSGLIGGVVGIGVAFGVLVAARSTFVSLNGHDPGPYEVALLDLAVILATGTLAATAAAYLPARTAARVPVLAALAGRRPLARVPSWMVPSGLVLFGTGSLILFLVASASRTSGGGDTLAAAAVLGGVAVLAGVCCGSPAMVAGLGPIARRGRGSMRLAARSLTRSRARSAAVVTALATVSTVAITVATFAATTGPQTERLALAADTLVVTTDATAGELAPGVVKGPATSRGTYDPGPVEFAPTPPATTRAIDAIIPDAAWSPIRVAVYDPAPETTETYDERVGVWGQLTVADPAVVDAAGLSGRDREALDRHGVLYLDLVPPDAPAETSALTQSGPVPIPVVAAADPERAHSGVSRTGWLVTEEMAAQLGFTIVVAGDLVRTPDPFNAAQRAGLGALRSEQFVEDAFGPPSIGDTTFIEIGGRDGPSAVRIQAFMAAAVLALVLLVVAIALCLFAAEGRDERDVLVAVGARPATLRRTAAWRAALLVLTGSVLAVPAGLIPITLILRAVETPEDPAGLEVPWTMLGALLVVIPLLAALLSGAASGLAQRARPVRMSNLAVD